MSLTATADTKRLPSCRVLPSFGRCQIILLGDGHMFVNNVCRVTHYVTPSGWELNLDPLFHESDILTSYSTTSYILYSVSKLTCNLFLLDWISLAAKYKLSFYMQRSKHKNKFFECGVDFRACPGCLTVVSAVCAAMNGYLGLNFRFVLYCEICDQWWHFNGGTRVNEWMLSKLGLC